MISNLGIHQNTPKRLFFFEKNISESYGLGCFEKILTPITQL